MIISLWICIAALTSSTEGATLKDDCVTSHNTLRARHEDTPPLQWDEELAKKAKRYANTLLSIQQLKHERPSNGLGENLYMSNSQKIATCAEASLSWYNEINQYSYQTGKSINQMLPVGHFTQLVWKSSLRFGVGIATGKSRRNPQNMDTYIVAKYSPQGNFHTTGRYLESYTKNVRPLKAGVAKKPTLPQQTADMSKPESQEQPANSKPTGPSPVPGPSPVIGPSPVPGVHMTYVGKGKVCNAKSTYTYMAGKCFGWPSISFDLCNRRCITNEIPKHCNQRRICKYALWYGHPTDRSSGRCYHADYTCKPVAPNIIRGGKRWLLSTKINTKQNKRTETSESASEQQSPTEDPTEPPSEADDDAPPPDTTETSEPPPGEEELEQEDEGEDTSEAEDGGSPSVSTGDGNGAKINHMLPNKASSEVITNKASTKASIHQQKTFTNHKGKDNAKTLDVHGNKRKI